MQNDFEQKQKTSSSNGLTTALSIGALLLMAIAFGALILPSLPSGYRPHHHWRPKPSPLVTAVKAKNVSEVQRILKSGVQVDVHNDTDFSPLGWATITGNKRMVHLLRAYGATFGNPYSKDGTDLGLAATWGSMPYAKRLLEALPPSKTVDEDKRTAILNAASQGHPDMIRLLLQHGAEIKSKNRDSELALWWATEQGCDDVAKILLDHGVSPNARDEHGNSVLIAAVVSEHEDLVRAVLAHGADVTLRGSYNSDRGQDTALSVATANKNSHICEILRKAGAKA